MKLASIIVTLAFAFVAHAAEPAAATTAPAAGQPAVQAKKDAAPAHDMKDMSAKKKKKHKKETK